MHFVLDHAPPELVGPRLPLGKESRVNPLVALEAVGKTYGSGPGAVSALDALDLMVPEGEFVSIVGPSGCGKSTVLNLIAGLDEPSRGRVRIAGRDLATMSERGRSDLRLRFIGFVFQGFNLLPRLTVERNVAWRLERLGVRGRALRERTAAVLEQVGVRSAAWSRYPNELSGGEQQRVAAARAIATEPRLLLADEPTGNLDSANGRMILDLLRRLNVERRTSVVMVTHDAFAATYGHRTVEMHDGRIVRDVGSLADAPPPLRLAASLRESQPEAP
ncbi:ABC transporter ATP-binding protein [Candidatus Binatia bacterium]|jgi:putative ABC transport system ATP-binding protein|nr:ABC transporter ATP-binding protein [Candidatus Binatia bacterium]